jgi:protoheme ferro-lyase
VCGDEVLLTLTLALTLTRYVAMRYWYPFTSDALEAIKRDGIERLVVVPLYPQVRGNG